MPQELKHKQENKIILERIPKMSYSFTLFLPLATDVVDINTSLTKASKQERHNFLCTRRGKVF